MVDDVATENRQPASPGLERRLRSHPTPYNLQCIATIVPQLRRKTDWNRSTMDPLLQNDTRNTRVNLDQEESIKFLGFMYPDQLLLSKIGGKSAEKVGHSMMEEVLKVFRQREWYGSTSAKGRTRKAGWLPKSGCPSLDPKSIKDREVQLAKFLNNVLGVVSEVCKVPFFHWDAKSANLPLDGSYACRKPDITCYFDASGTRHHWGQVATFCEVKNRNDGSKQSQSFTEIAGKTSCILVTQDGRHLVPCVRLLGSCICLTIFDHGGSITTHSFDIHESPTVFLHILMGVSLANYSTLGFDMSIKWDGKVAEPDDEKIALDDEENVPDDKELEPDDEMAQADDESQLDDEEPDPGDEQPPMINVEGKRRKWLEIVNKEGRICTIWLEKILSISDSLVGRGSTVWEGVINSESDVPGAEEVVVVKDSWIDPLRKYTEGMILHILEQNGVEGVPTLLAERQVKIQHHAGEAVETNLSTHFIRSMLHNIRSPNDFHLRVLSRLVTRPVGTLIIDFSSLGELLVAFLDCIITHKDAVNLARILHRDISLVNLLLATTKAEHRTTHEKYIQYYISGQAQVDLCKRISCLTRRGVLADWGYATPITPTTVSADSPSTPSSEGDPPTLPTEIGPLASQMPIGAWVEAETPIDLVPVRQIDGVTMVSASQLTDEHDIVLLMGTDDPKKDLRHTIDSSPLYRTSEKELEECYGKLFNTFNPNVVKTSTIQSDVTWLPLVVKHISSYFQPLVPLLKALRDTIISPMHTDVEGKFYRRTLFNHDMIIEHFVMALSSLGPESWGDPDIPEPPSQTVSKQVTGDPDKLLVSHAEHVMVPKSLKRTRTEKCEGQLPFLQVPHPPPPVPLTPGWHGAWSHSRQPLMQPHDGDSESDEYVPSHYGKRRRLSNQDHLQPEAGPSTSSALPDNRVQDDIPLRRSPRKKPDRNFPPHHKPGRK
ncbi:hypothetical protein JVT61DRAFT_9518 [Boletus reticuloceps]|uniref:Fungal-type protein kinase domain-containing protein n=1 Tax=Boletus reticuloceps TaxID=495285 RepID=A0A8I3A4R2_9AGAM|nr:hypothetical protein JVT61DRAFT_9518 [Boletus reticuloceps]